MQKAFLQGPHLVLTLCLQIKKKVEARHHFNIGQNPGKTHSQYAVGDSKKPHKIALFYFSPQSCPFNKNKSI